MKTPLIARLLLVLAVPVTSVSLAQTPPDAGALQQQIERERQQQLPRRIAPDKPATPAVLPPLAGIVVTVKQFRFVGNTLLSAEQLAPAVAPFLDRPLDYNQLQAAAAAVAETYRAAGWVVRAYLPQQDIKDGSSPSRSSKPSSAASSSKAVPPGSPANSYCATSVPNKPGVPRSTPTPSTAPSCLPTTCPASPSPAASPPAPPRVKPT